MDADELCEEIKENLLNLGVDENKTLNDISSLTIEDIYGLYKDIVRRGHTFYFQNKDLHISAKQSLKFFQKLFQEYGINDLGDIIPKEYQFDIIGDLHKTLSTIHDQEKSMAKVAMDEGIEDERKLAKNVEQKTRENYNKYYSEQYELKKKEKALKKKRKFLAKRI